MRKYLYHIATLLLVGGACAWAGRQHTGNNVTNLEIETLRQDLHGAQKRLLTREQQLDELFDHVVLSGGQSDGSRNERTIEIWQRFDEMALLSSPNGAQTEDVVALNRLAWFHLQRNKPAAALRSCLLYTSPSPRDATLSRMPSSA